MKYDIKINQRVVMANGWKLKANHMAVYQVITEFMNSPMCNKISDTNGSWSWVSHKLIINDLPMFDIKERRCSDLIKDLCECNLLELNPNNKMLGRTYLRVGVNYDLLNSDYAIKDTPTQNIANPYAKYCETPTQNIADNNTITNNKNTNTNIVNFQNFENSTQSQNDFILDEKKENAPQTGGAVFDKKNWVEGHGDGELQSKLLEYYNNPNSVVYAKEMYKEFKAYWTAIVQNGKGKGKELWRTKDTFLVSGRLSTWSRNNFNNESKNQSNGNSNTNPRHKDNWNAEQTALDALAISKARFAEQRQFEQ